MNRKLISLVAAGVTVVLGVSAFGINEAAAKDVIVAVDGQVENVRSYHQTVGDVLEERGITVGEHDQVQPSLNYKINDGTEISIKYGRKLTVTIDGKEQEIWTTATTVAEALEQMEQLSDQARISTSRNASISREGMALSIENPATVTVATASETKKVTLFGTVADAVKAAGVSTKNTQITPALTTKLTDGMKIQVVSTGKVTVEKTVVVPFKTVQTNDPTLDEGKTKVKTEGKNGKSIATIEQTLRDGKVVSEKQVSIKVVTKPVNKVVLVGTKVDPETAAKRAEEEAKAKAAGLDLRRMDMWNRIAYRESKCNWSINTGNGYYGGLQFAPGTWKSAGGTKFAARADLATKEQQITIANGLYDKVGIQPWAKDPVGGKHC